MFKIKIPTRLHITLIAMHSNSYRQNGGVGFAIDSPSLEIDFYKSDTIVIEDKRENGFSLDEQGRIIKVLEKIQATKGFNKGILATIRGNAPTHMGFGSGTAVRLALIEGLYLINKKPYTSDEIILASERGGVSGIGIEIYFHGGLILDIGRSDKSEFAPSSEMEQKRKKLPLTLRRVDMPLWKIGVCIPDIKAKTEQEEKEFFAKTCPIDETESYKALYYATYGILGSAIENDKEIFSKAIQEIQTCQWKSAERQLYGNELEKVEEILYKCGADAVGMSSLGPSLFFIADDVSKVGEAAKKELISSKIFIANVNNTGREILHD